MDGVTASTSSLNPMDRIVLAIDDVMREQGGAGFETQAFLFLDDRIDVDRLRRAVARLARRHPVIAARLVRPSRPYEPHWSFHSAGINAVREHWLESSDPETVLSLAADLMGAPRDLSKDDPLSFHVIHGADGRDVVVIQYNHVLMDIYAVVPCLAEIDRLTSEEGDESRSDLEEVDPMARQLRTIPGKRLLEGAWDSLALRFGKLRKPATVYGNGLQTLEGPPVYRCLTRSLDKATTRNLEAHAAKACGFASLSMSLLAGAYRSIWAGRSSDADAHELLAAGVGIDLGLRRSQRLVFSNLVSVVPVYAFSDELGDRDELVRILSRRLRERIQRSNDWSLIHLTSMLRRRRAVIGRFARGIVTEGISFWFAYFGALDAVGSRFCGVRVNDVLMASPSCAPAGLSMVGHKFQGRLSILVTYMPALVSDAEAHAFLDVLIGDLTQGRG